MRTARSNAILRPEPHLNAVTHAHQPAGHRGACPGYVVDHVTPLKRGGADKPSNMQWQTKEAATQKKMGKTE
jgi:hypothetical protein